MAKVLVIDDDADIGTMVKMILEFNGYRVWLEDGANKVYQILQNNQMDLIIMDMLLSGANGTDLCAWFKADSTTAHIPIMMMSAHTDAMEVCLAAGANDFLAKPFDIKDLLKKCQVLLH